jgi:hypothetical protein
MLSIYMATPNKDGFISHFVTPIQATPNKDRGSSVTVTLVGVALMVLQSDWWTPVLVRCSLDLCYKVTDEPQSLLGVAWTSVTVTDEPLSLLGVAWIGVTKWLVNPSPC